MKIINVVGARPNFMKIAPLMRAYEKAPDLDPVLVHTGQHYDRTMSALFFDELGIPRPDLNLEVGSGTHARQTADVMVRFEEVCAKLRPNLVLVVGDVNSTLACALVASKLGVRVAHVEAGLRSFDRSMPEEINRIVTDAISDLLFVTEPSGVANLRREGVPDERVHFVGNVMIDTLLANLERARSSTVLTDLRLAPGEYGVVTLHRPSNVDDLGALTRIVAVLSEIATELRLVWPVHPRTRTRLENTGLLAELKNNRAFEITDALGYLDFLKLNSHARLIFTDSGGIQEEATVLKVPCITLRENTERPVTCAVGANRLVGSDPTAIREAYRWARQAKREEISSPELWDGHAAERIAVILQSCSGVG